MDKLIYPATVFSFGDGSPKEILNEAFVWFITHGKIGDTLTSWASAPGTGRIVYKVTRVLMNGVYGEEIENTISCPEGVQ